MKPGNRQYQIDTVPIHTKRYALIDERKVHIFMPFCSYAERHLFV